MSTEIDRLGYLLKHAQMRLTELTSAALEPYNLIGRELAVLLTFADGEPQSQQQAAHHLGVDRTTMVALVDTLEAKNLVARHPDPADRRRNVVALTPHGRDILHAATQAAATAEQTFLAPLPPTAAQALKTALKALVTTPTHPTETRP